MRPTAARAEYMTMNLIVEKRLAELNRHRPSWNAFSRRSREELKAVPDAMRWLLGINR